MVSPWLDVHGGLRRYDKPVGAFNRVIELTPRDSGAYINLAASYSGLEQRERALEFYDKAFALTPAFRTDIVTNREFGFALVNAPRCLRFGASSWSVGSIWDKSGPPSFAHASYAEA